MQKSENNYTDVAQKVFLTLEEAATFTGLSKSYLYKLTSRGIIPHSKPQGKLIFFERTKLEGWLRQNSTEGLNKVSIEQAASSYVLLHEKGGLK